MCKPTSSAQHDVVQCRVHGSNIEFLFEFQTEFFLNFFRVSSCSRIKPFDYGGSTVCMHIYIVCLCVSGRTYVYMYVCMYVSTYEFVCVCVCVCAF